MIIMQLMIYGIGKMMTLTSEQIQAVQCGEPVPIIPPEIGQECVMLRRDVYDQLRQTSEAGDFDPRDSIL